MGYGNNLGNLQKEEREMARVDGESCKRGTGSTASPVRGNSMYDVLIVTELRAYLNTLTITGDNIGDIRRSLFFPFDSRWNGIVRDETAAREQASGAVDPHVTDTGTPPTRDESSISSAHQAQKES